MKIRVSIGHIDIRNHCLMSDGVLLHDACPSTCLSCRTSNSSLKIEILLSVYLTAGTASYQISGDAILRETMGKGWNLNILATGQLG